MSSTSEGPRRSVLHVLTGPTAQLAREVIARQCADEACRVRVWDLTVPNPDYSALVDAVFAADSITVW